MNILELLALFISSGTLASIIRMIMENRGFSKDREEQFNKMRDDIDGVKSDVSNLAESIHSVAINGKNTMDGFLKSTQEMAKTYDKINKNMMKIQIAQFEIMDRELNTNGEGKYAKEIIKETNELLEEIDYNEKLIKKNK